MTTTYNEVADELVKEFKDEETDSDEKNIRRYCSRDLDGVASGRAMYVHAEAGASWIEGGASALGRLVPCVHHGLMALLVPCRRAYDALNVLTAMDIIAKDKKDIQWKGFPPMVSSPPHT